MVKSTQKTAGFAQRAKGFCHRFGRDEDGVISLQFLWQFPFMLWFGYIAIDVMMHEFERTRLQNTLDRAVLAAADLDQEGKPEEVVRSYFKAAGIEDSIDTIVVKEGLNMRKVEATASISVPTVFLSTTDSGYRNNQETPYAYDKDSKQLDNYEARGSSLPAVRPALRRNPSATWRFLWCSTCLGRWVRTGGSSGCAMRQPSSSMP